MADQPNRLGAFGLSDDRVGYTRGNIQELRFLEHLGAIVDLDLACPVSDQEAFAPCLRRTRNGLVNPQVVDVECSELAPMWWRLAAAEQSHNFPPRFDQTHERV